MSIHDEARQEAWREYPLPFTNQRREFQAQLHRRAGFERGYLRAVEREPSDAEVLAGAFVIDEGAMDSPVDYPLQAEAAMSLSRDVLQAAKEARRGR